MREVGLEDNNTLKICPGSFIDASKLKFLLVAELTKQGISIPSNVKDVKDLAKIEINGDIVSKVLSNILLIEANEEITNQIIICAKKSLLNDEKITLKTFEDPKLWPILLEIKIEVIKENVVPFFQNLLSIVKRQIGSIDLDSLLK